MTTTEQALQRNQWLHKNGKQLLAKFDFISTLTTLGEVQPIGSFSYGLMQVADLDFKVYCPELNPSSILDLADSMARRPDVIGLRHLDFTKQPNAQASGIYLNIFPYFEGELWKLDVLFLPLSTRPTEEDTLVRQLKAVTPEQRDTILTLKAQLLKAGLYSDPAVFHTASVVHGVEVYRAVFEGAQTVEEVMAHKEKPARTNPNG